MARQFPKMDLYVASEVKPEGGLRWKVVREDQVDRLLEDGSTVYHIAAKPRFRGDNEVIHLQPRGRRKAPKGAAA
jgi:hypothetical protein